MKDINFDDIMLSHLFEHLHDLAGALRKAFRLLQPGGLICIVVSNIDGASIRVYE